MSCARFSASEDASYKINELLDKATFSFRAHLGEVLAEPLRPVEVRDHFTRSVNLVVLLGCIHASFKSISKVWWNVVLAEQVIGAAHVLGAQGKKFIPKLLLVLVAWVGNNAVRYSVAELVK